MSAVFRKKGRTVTQRFYDLCIPEPNSGCWLWLGNVSKKTGYAGFATGDARKFMSGHRYSWELHFGAIPPGKVVCHTCDIRCCVNPEHLFLGTQDDNVQDMRRKGRARYAHGEAHVNALLNEEAVRLIRSNDTSPYALAKIFNVAPTTIISVRRRDSWKHV